MNENPEPGSVSKISLPIDISGYSHYEWHPGMGIPRAQARAKRRLGVDAYGVRIQGILNGKSGKIKE